MKTFSLIFLLTAFVIIAGWCAADKPEVGDERGPVDGGSCEYKSYSGLMTVENIVFDHYESEGFYIHYEFQADDVDAPRILRPVKWRVNLKKSEFSKAVIEPGKKFRVNAQYITSGVCAPGPYLEDVELWQKAS